LTRESARVDQQKSLDELAGTMKCKSDNQRNGSSIREPGRFKSDTGSTGSDHHQLRNTRASGRVALAVKPKDKDLSDFPNMVMKTAIV